MTQYKYGEAIVPVTYGVCGINLKSFCLGHFILLEKIDSPFISVETKDVDVKTGLPHFFLALLICSLSFEDGLVLLDNAEELQRLSEKFTVNLMKNMMVEPNWNFLSKLNLFKNYLKYHLDMPLYDEKQSTGDDTASGTDWKNSIFIVFKKLGYSESQILNMSLKKLFYEWCSYAENEGAIKVWNKFEYEQFARMKKG